MSIFSFAGRPSARTAAGSTNITTRRQLPWPRCCSSFAAATSNRMNARCPCPYRYEYTSQLLPATTTVFFPLPNQPTRLSPGAQDVKQRTVGRQGQLCHGLPHFNTTTRTGCWAAEVADLATETAPLNIDRWHERRGRRPI